MLPYFHLHTTSHLFIPEGVGRGAHYGTLRGTTEKFTKNRKKLSNPLPHPGIETETLCLAIALRITRPSRCRDIQYTRHLLQDNIKRKKKR
uniref:SFRICE_027711 n=1 Tax=Spodoptera frugiperda TaxID=7108 RepID=A0A2H1WI57_SPOFR